MALLRNVLLVCLLLSVAAANRAAHAQPYPAKAVRIVVGFAHRWRHRSAGACAGAKSRRAVEAIGGGGQPRRRSRDHRRRCRGQSRGRRPHPAGVPAIQPRHRALDVQQARLRPYARLRADHRAGLCAAAAGGASVGTRALIQGIRADRQGTTETFQLRLRRPRYGITFDRRTPQCRASAFA